MSLTERIKRLALNNGYDLVGVASPVISAAEQADIRAFVHEGRAGEMDWFARHLELRLDPRAIFPEVRSILMLGVLYRQPENDEALAQARVRVARYAQGRDYHRLLRKRGRRLLQLIRAEEPSADGRVTVDSAPVSEKSLARAAGLGRRGKHTNLIHPELGSYFFISALFLNLDLAVDGPIDSRCGECRLCLDACPTKALEPYRIDARRCLSYATIEVKEAFPTALQGKTKGWAFGCDICQEVCPYNVPVTSQSGRTAGDPAFLPRPWVSELMSSGTLPEPPEWEDVSQGSPLRRAGLKRLSENVREATGESD